MLEDSSNRHHFVFIIAIIQIQVQILILESVLDVTTVIDRLH